jgi:hypothetical protein
LETDVHAEIEDADLPNLLRTNGLVRHLVDRPAGTRFACNPEAFQPASSIASGTESPVAPWSLGFLGADNDAGLEERSDTKLVGSALESNAPVAEVPFKMCAEEALRRWHSLDGTSAYVVDAKSKATLTGWDGLKSHVAPVTALVVCDRYALHEPERIKENIAGLIATFLSRSDGSGVSGSPVPVTVVTEKEGKGDVNYALKMLRERHTTLSALLRRNVPGVPITLSLVAAGPQKAETHDRFAFANHGCLLSGQSFNLFRSGKPSTETTLQFVPFTRRSGFEAALQKLRSVAKLVEKSSETNAFGTIRVGPKSNPLLDAAR